MNEDEKVADLDFNISSALESNVLIDAAIGEEHEKASRKNEKYIAESNSFQEAIKAARSKLGFDNTEIIDEGYINEWASKRLGSSAKGFFDEVESILSKLSLPPSWNFYVAVYIINKKPPKSWAFSSPDAIRVEEVTGNNEVLVRLKPGLRREDYIAAWGVLKGLLGPSKRLDKPYTSDDSDAVFNARLEGLSYSLIAKRFYPSMEKRLAIDRVKKIVAREKQRRERGTNLAK
jgi:hypothetical protein